MSETPTIRPTRMPWGPRPETPWPEPVLIDDDFLDKHGIGLIYSEPLSWRMEADAPHGDVSLIGWRRLYYSRLWKSFYDDPVDGAFHRKWYFAPPTWGWVEGWSAERLRDELRSGELIWSRFKGP